MNKIAVRNATVVILPGTAITLNIIKDWKKKLAKAEWITWSTKDTKQRKWANQIIKI